MMAPKAIAILSAFPSWVPKSSKIVNMLLLITSFSTATTLGYDSSMMNALNILPSYTDYFNLSAATIGLNSGIVGVGCCIGSIFFVKLPDQIGRRPALFYAAVIAIIGILLQAAAQNIAMFLVARFIVGFGIGGTYTVCPVYLAETLPMAYRALGLGAFNDLYYVGALISAGVTYGTAKMASTWAWRLPSALQGVFAIVSIITLPFVPESPRFLAYHNRQEEALLSIAQTQTNGDVSDPIAQLQYVQIVDALEFEKNIEPPSIKTMAMKPSIRKRMLILLSVAAFSMLTGSNIFGYYLGTVLDNAGITDSTTQLEINIILNAFCLVVAVAGTFLADRLGRKPLATISTFFCLIFLFIIGALTKVYGDSTNKSAIYANVAMIFLAQGSYSFAWTPLFGIYPPEILNYQIRNLGLSLFTFWENALGLIPIFAFPIAMEKIGWKIYMLNGAWDVFELLVVIFYWVETKNKTLEEIDELFDGEVHSQVQGINTIIHSADQKVVEEILVGIDVSRDQIGSAEEQTNELRSRGEKTSEKTG